MDDLASAWRRAGITDGTVLLLHSNIVRTLFKLGGDKRELGRILQSFRDAVGATGTLLLPAFNFGFANGQPFDIRATPSACGALSEAARALPDAVRTGHPLYSFVALGARANEFRQVCNTSGYGTDSPFGLLHRFDGRIAALDVDDQDCMTFYHYVEECHQVPWRYHKYFSGSYTDAAGMSSTRTFSLFVRDLAGGIRTSLGNAEQLLWGHAAYHGDRPLTGHGLRTIKARLMFNCVAEIIRSGRAEGMLYDRADV